LRPIEGGEETLTTTPALYYGGMGVCTGPDFQFSKKKTEKRKTDFSVSLLFFLSVAGEIAQQKAIHNLSSV
jgi:hypothetical protein